MTLRRRAALSAAAVLAVVAAIGGAMAVSAGDDPRVAVGFLMVTLWLGAALGVVGALLIGWRPGNLLGPVLFVAGAGLLGEYVLRAYAYLSRPGIGHSSPWSGRAGWAGLLLDPLFFPTFLVLTLLLFPDGRPPSPRWRVLTLAVVAVTAVHVLLLALRPGPIPDESFGYDVSWHGVLPPASAIVIERASEAIDSGLVWVLLLCCLALVPRYRAASGLARQQYKPLVLLAVVVGVGLLLQIVPPTEQAGKVVLVAGLAVGLPAALAVSALRYRLWELDWVIVATIVYGTLAVLVTALYVGIVLGVSRLAGGVASAASGGPIVATIVVAVLFGPVREWLTWAARRMVYGVRASPYQVLAALPHQLADSPGVDDVLSRVAAAMQGGLGVGAARVRALLDDGTQLTAWSPPDVPAPGAALLVVPVRHLGHQVGDVAVLPSPDRSLDTKERRLLADLAAQVGPALRGVALAAELRARLEQITTQAGQLRASRERLANAHIEERRRLERDVHDGAQQRLVTLAMRLATVGGPGGVGDPAVDRALEECRQELDRCIDDLRDLARGLYPPVLAARGLVPALRARLRTLPGPALLEADPEAEAARLLPGVELAVYFCCLEALQNATKHAPGSTITIRVTRPQAAAEGLEFEVSDTGPGFDPHTARGAGRGLVGMQDRLEAVGGTFSVVSAKGRGTTIRGWAAVPSADGEKPANQAMP